MEKEIIEVATTVTRYIYDNEDILLELDGINNIVARYTHGPGIDEPLVMEKGGASFFYQADGLGSITEITDTIGTVVQAYTYSSFGKIESQLDPNFVQPYTFTAREFDPETGLYFYRARYYDAAAGRFLQEDPIGFLGGDINLYPYVSNAPIGSVDPFGLIFSFQLDSVTKSLEAALLKGNIAEITTLLLVIGKGLQFQARNPKLRDVLVNLFRLTDKFPGGTAGILRLGRTDHLEKAIGRARQLRKLIDTSALCKTDRIIAEAVLKDLESAIALVGGKL